MMLLLGDGGLRALWTGFCVFDAGGLGSRAWLIAGTWSLEHELDRDDRNRDPLLSENLG